MRARDNVGMIGDYNSGGTNVSAATGASTKCAIRWAQVAAPFATIVSDEIVVQERGVYIVSLSVAFAANATGTRRAEVWKNGTLWDVVESPANGTNALTLRYAGCPLRLVPGDRVACYGLQTSGGALNMQCGISILKTASLQ